MATNLKRFMISVTPEMEASLDVIKKEYYYKKTQNDMIRDLISRGLEYYSKEYENHGMVFKDGRPLLRQ